MPTIEQHEVLLVQDLPEETGLSLSVWLLCMGG